MNIYIAGPMRGYHLFNFPAFDDARDRLIEIGHAAISPADMDRAEGLDPFALPDDWDWSIIPDGFDLQRAIQRDIDAILHRADGLCLLPGWEQSSGAQWEYALAQVRKLPICHSENLCTK